MSAWGQLVLACLLSVNVWGALCCRRFPALNARILRLHLGLSWAAMLVLWSALWWVDLEMIYVAENVSHALPWYFKLSALWGAHEGSFLLWLTLMATWAYATLRPGGDTTDHQALFYYWLLAIALLAFLMITSNPFEVFIPAGPLQGRDLNPLLQDPGMVFHPPMLYAGYVGFIVPAVYALAVAKQDSYADFDWRLLMEPVRLATVFLTWGMTLGSWWAYRELGWGGFWAWDPVENVSLLPWLMGVAAMHVWRMDRPRQHFLRLQVIVFSACLLSLMGTFLVRSGLLVSVHSFSSDPQRGLWLLVVFFLLSAYGGSLLLWCQPSLKPQKTYQALLLWLAVHLWLVFFAVVLLGTWYPLIYQLLTETIMTVGSNYYQDMSWSLLLVALLVLFCDAMKHLTVPALLWTSPLIVLLFFLSYPLSSWLVMFMTALVLLTSWLYLGRQGSHSLKLMHLSFLMVILGLLLHQEASLTEQALAVGESMNVGPWQVTLHSKTTGHRHNYRFERFQLALTRGQQQVLVYPERRLYDVSGQVMAKSALYLDGLADVYLVVSENIEGRYALRAYYKPGVVLLWLGGFLLGVGLLWRRYV